MCITLLRKCAEPLGDEESRDAEQLMQSRSVKCNSEILWKECGKGSLCGCLSALSALLLNKKCHRRILYAVLEHSEPHTDLMWDSENSQSCPYVHGAFFAFCYWHWHVDSVPD